ncbi:hypothetical protein Cgig2_013006 [Carnegiea gigantea]|uniref:Helicase ATP-binding domain-containing protein n=1 Tax=Carnegiea gigantea TaxID=171969 RepID=A0A9Q1GQ27_9CARY|nr:hypothetical protein Cgig2_013006 [Carnegiea gigantea]
MNALSLPTFSHISLSSPPILPFPSTRCQFSVIQFPELGFCSLKSLPTKFPPSFKSPNSTPSVENQISDAEDDEETEDFDDDDEAAFEYVEVSDSEDEDGAQTQAEEELSAPPFWIPNEPKFQRVQKLCDEVREFSAGIIDADELASIYDFRIDRFQRSAIKAFLGGSSVVVSAPTSSGKTLIAEAAAVATVARGKRLFYTTPLKALSNQKFREFRETFGEINVGLLTGDSAVNKDAQILIMTTEILRNMLYQSVGVVSSGSGLFNVDVIVLDEVHYLSDTSRGSVWEETVIYCPKEVQLICLSATVANPDELAGWIGQVWWTYDELTDAIAW